MSFQNTPNSFGLVSRTLHWLTALLILSAIPLGIIANDMLASPETIASKTQLFSLHKTMGVAAFLIGLARILWALGQTRPVALHPHRRLETLVADLVHWLLYLSLMIVPFSGWVHHAAVDGFAPILWPFGQGLPFVPKSETLAALAGGLHWLFTKLLIASILLHIAGALKHHFLDRDATLARMTRGAVAPEAPETLPHRLAPLALALAVYAAGTGAALWLVPAAETAPVAEVTATAGGNWQVREGTLRLGVQQMGTAVEGIFAGWSAEIAFDDSIAEGKAGTVVVEIDLTTLTLGSVGDQAKGPEFLDVATHPKARFTADLIADGDAYQAVGTLSLHGVEKPLTLPFTLSVEGDSAKMSGSVQLDRRDFGVGAAYDDEATVGFAVTVNVALTADRK